VKIMNRLRVAWTAVFLASSMLPAIAADWPVRPAYAPLPAYVPPAPPPAVAVWPRAPYYIVNQGPVYSGPAFMILDMGITNTDLRRRYPFVRASARARYWWPH
jgi:hypothetical protein